MRSVIKYCLLVTMGLAVAGCSKKSSQNSESDERENQSHADEHKKSLDGHEGVQLWKDGPYWAETNIGAEKPWDFGCYFWWGDTMGQKRTVIFQGEGANSVWVASNGSRSGFSFKEWNTPTYGKDVASLQNEKWITADNVLTPLHDAAQVQWGGAWRMPTRQELVDLNEKCDWTWAETNDVNGYIVRGRDDYASASIFLPAAGFGDGTSLSFASTALPEDGVGGYRSSVPSEYNSAWGLIFSAGKHSADDNRRDLGMSVRPVQGFTKDQTK